MAFNGKELGLSEKEGGSGQCSVSVGLSRPCPLAEHVLWVVWGPQDSGPGQNNRGSSASIQESSGVPTPASDTYLKEGKDWRSRTQRGGSPGLGWLWGEEAGELAACSCLRGEMDSHLSRLQGQKAVTLCVLGHLWLKSCVRSSKSADITQHSALFTSSGPVLPGRRLLALQPNLDPWHSQP